MLLPRLWLACLTLLVAGVAAVKFNPLPAPRNINWASSGPKQLAGFVSLRASQNTSDFILANGWDRAWDSIVSLQWVPAATEGPVPSFQPFPTGTAGVARRSSQALPSLQFVDVDVLDLAQISSMGWMSLTPSKSPKVLPRWSLRLPPCGGRSMPLPLSSSWSSPTDRGAC